MHLDLGDDVVVGYLDEDDIYINIDA